MAGLSDLQRGLMAIARLVYRWIPFTDAFKKRIRFFVKTRLGVLFGKRRAWSYERWVGVFDTVLPADAAGIAAFAAVHPDVPRFTVVVPVPGRHGRAHRHAVACLKSVRTQLYDRVDLVVSGPGANAALLLEAGYGFGGGSAELAPSGSESGSDWLRAGVDKSEAPWLVLLRHDAILAPDALALCAAAILEHPDARAFYGDEDQLNPDGSRAIPMFKPALNRDLLLAQDYTGPGFVVQREALSQIGGIAAGLDEGPVYDLALRLTADSPQSVQRISFVLTHRQPNTSEGGLGEEQRRIVLDALARRSVPVDGADVLPTGDLWVRYPVGKNPPLVSLIVPTRDRVDLLRTCVTGLLNQTDYPNLEVIIVDNQSRAPETLAYFKQLAGEPRVRILPYDAPFDYSRMNNSAARVARGTVLGLINNDVAVIEAGWLRELVGHALRPEVGAVGPKLLYGDGTIQHAGIVMGLLGFTGHVYRHERGDALGHGRRLTVAQEVSAVTGACMVLRRELYIASGGLDESMPVSCSDVDLCLRLAQQGYHTVFTPHALLYHLESVSRGYEKSAEQWEETRREEAVLRDRWAAALGDDPAYSPNLSLDAERPSPAVPPRVRRPWRAPMDS